MLLELRVKDYAIMEDLTLEFSGGLNILTGETGAGKSIIIDALSLLLGERADSELIRTGKSRATVEGVFDLSGNSRLKRLVNDMEIPTEEELLYVTRVVTREGRGRCRMNQSNVPVVSLKKIGDRILDIHGQHQHQSLLHVDKHLELLDGFGGLTQQREEFSSLTGQYVSGLRELESLREKSRALKERMDFVTFQRKEIELAHLQPDEDVALERERDILENFEKLVTNLAQVYSIIYEEDDSVLSRLSTCLKSLNQANMIDPSVARQLQGLRTCYCQLEEISRDLERYLGEKEFDAQRLEEVNRRIDLIQKLKRKYGTTISEILARGAELEKEIGGLESIDERIRATEGRLNALRTELERRALSLSEERKRTALELQKRIVEEMKDLGMSNVQFKIAVETNESPEGVLNIDDRTYWLAPSGIDSVEFLISPNVGEELKPLRKIASGGELSRIMLSIKSILAGIDEISVLVFDEIDVGIGGRTAESVGRKLKSVSRGRQVICITHLPQIAAYADVHYRVDKQESGGRTHTEVKRLEFDERIDEIARMLSGEQVTDLTRETAAQLLVRVGGS